MQKAVSTALEFLEGPLVMGTRTMDREEAMECMREAKASGLSTGLPMCPEALLTNALQHPLLDLSGQRFVSVEKWLLVRHCATVGIQVSTTSVFASHRDGS